AFARRHADVAQFLQPGQRRVDHAGAGAVGAAGEILDLLDDLVAVPRAFADQVQREQPQVAMREQPARSALAAFAVLVAAVVFMIVAVVMTAAPGAFAAMAAAASVSVGCVMAVGVVARHRRLFLDISFLRYI